MRRYIVCFVLLCTAIVTRPCKGLAQSASVLGSIEGFVVDTTGAAIPKARVTAKHLDWGASRMTETGQSGQFRFNGLAIGRYQLQVEKQGFGSVVVSPFLLSVGQTVQQQIEMKPAQVVQQVEVKEQPEALDTASTTPSVALGYDRVEEAPAPGRNYLNFALVAPGVTSSSGSSSQSLGPTQGRALGDTGLVFGGLRGRNNSITIDGVDNRDETTGGNRVSVGLEMVQEFRVLNVAVPAEYGGAAGGIVNVVTRSGTNTWHGDATFFAQNELFNARKPDVESPSKPRFRRYQPGTSINGPIRKDRTFISAAFEQEFESSQEWSEVPADAVEAINTALAQPLYSNAAVRTALRGLFGAKSRGTDLSFKINHQASSANTLTARYAFSRGRVLNDVQDVANFTDRSARGSSLTDDHSLVLGWTGVPSANLANDLRFQFARRRVELAPNSHGAMLEIPGVVTLGESYRLNGARTEDHYELVDNASLIAGRHQIGFGGDIHAVNLDARLANRFAGVFIFPTLGDFVAGRPDVFFQAFGNPKTNLTTVPVGFWFQDRWQARDSLTLQAGFRYDRQAMPDAIPASNRNWSPRLGLAWRPDKTKPLVLRAGFGLFYDRYPLAFLNDAIQKNGQHGFEQYVVGNAAAQVLALSEGGSTARPLPGVVNSICRADVGFPTTYSRKVAAGIEYGVSKDTTLTVEYNNVRGFHLSRTRNINGGLPPLYQLEQTARSSYQGASIYVNRRMSHEWTLLVDYDIGETWDDASDFDEQPLDPFDPRKDWARSRQHQAHRLAASSLFELPAEEWRSAPDWLRTSLVNITVSPVLIIGSGRPVNALDSTDVFRTGAYPITARPLALSRNPFFSPATVSLDLRVMKRFPFRRNRAWFTLGVEAFNLTNHANFARVSPYYAAQGSRLDSYRGPIEASSGRQLQLLLTVEF